ncbi:PAAR domain-containing protein [Pseudomonas sp. LS1212]|uniref:PAAR domain-containing protein n=1 Tax=Pseudomonas sp. LS1212 TaxID=2972478 RepID=UPI00215CE256|nr:PAAR domain-containing protein [Pseudomonas sp. LS1212]UVJ45642.1 PAAR domain-containing protein [Pseudomonas sp. LS1212]
MAKGHFIRKGDKTSCGGTVQEADTRVMMFGIAHAREGDRVTCGKDGKTYVISGGVPYINSHGRLVAGTLDSISTCPCKATLIPSLFKSTYESSRSAAPQATRTAAQPTTPAASNPSAAPRHSSFAPSSPSTPVVFNSVEPQEPGFYIAPKSMTREQLEASLFTVRDPAVMHKFQLLNPNLNDIKAGSMIVLSDPNNTSCTYQEAQLMQAAQEVKAALDPLTPEEAEFTFRHGAEIAAFIGQTSTWLGVGAAVMEKHLTNLRNTLQAMERLHQDSYRRHGHLKSAEFFAERKRLMSQLDVHLLNSTRLRGHTTLGDHPKLKTALGISSRSLVHHWDKAGAPGQIPGYATHVDSISRAAKYMQWGGWVGIGIGGISMAAAITAVCNAESDEACEKIKFTEGGKFALSALAGYGGGELAYLASSPICLALGVTTGIGGVVCVAAVVGTGAWIGTTAGGVAGEFLGEKLYEAKQR